MSTTKKIVIGIISSVLIVSIIVVLNMKNTTWNKEKFTIKVETYLAEKNIQEVETINTNYSFKQGVYESHIHLKNGLIFSVYEDENGELYDNYTVRIIAYSLETEGKHLVNKIWGNSSKFEVDIPFFYNDLDYIRSISSYSQLSENYKKKSNIYVFTNINFSKETKELKEYFTVINWIEDKNFQGNLVFVFNEDYSFRIPYESLKEIKTSENITKYF